MDENPIHQNFTSLGPWKKNQGPAGLDTNTGPLARG